MPLDLFHPTVAAWFRETLGEPTPPQVEGWPAIRDGHHTVIAAPTGTGKTLAAFLWALDELLCEGAANGDGDENGALPDETRVLYVSPLRALSNDVQKNLQAPLAELRERDPSLPEVRVLVRTGDTPQRERQKMRKTPPHILVTTPESLYILLTSAGGRQMLSTVRTVIIDEIHALVGDKRGAHLALSLERLDALIEKGVDSVSDENRTGSSPPAASGGSSAERGPRRQPPQRIGLSATQKPLSDIGNFLAGRHTERGPITLIDTGHLRELDLAMEVPPSELSAVCSHEQWAEIYQRMGELIREHRTTLVFVNTRKLAERVAAQLTQLLGADAVTSHHGSLSRERRLDAEQRLKAGKLKALVATASLELGIDIGDVDLVIQTGITPSIAAFLQRVGRAGHAKHKTPKGRLFPLTMDELVCGTALLDAVARGELDRTPQPVAPLDILAQQIVAACVTDQWDEAELFERLRRAWPYRELTREDFDRVIALHTDGRGSLLHRDGVHHRVRGTKRARLTAIMGGGAIPDNADYTVVQDPEGIVVGSVHEDFAIESSAGDIFQLGNTSWRILRVAQGTMRVADAEGAPPNLPFWIAEGPARTPELSHAVARLREQWSPDESAQPERQLPGNVPPAGVAQLDAYLAAARQVLGALPTQTRIIAERFFDESGGMQLVIHVPFGGRINRAFGLALRKRFCRSFGFELQAAANEEAIIISLGQHHSFPLAEVFTYLHPDTVREVLQQAILDQPLFQARWRWNVTRALVVERTRSGKRVPAPLLRMRAEDELVKAFPHVVACPENLESGDLPVPMDHPLVRQTIEDSLTEALDVDGLVALVQGIHDGTIETVAVDVPEPSPLARGVLNAMPYAFLDDAPLEERRTQAVMQRRVLDVKALDDIGQLDVDAVARVKDEAWPSPENAEELHEALLWMGYLRQPEAEAYNFGDWLSELADADRVVREGDRWYAAEVGRGEQELLKGRLSALGPVHIEELIDGATPDTAPPFDLLAIEREGGVLRCRLDGREAWCDRRLLARIHRYTVERLRQEIQPVTAAQYLRFLARWQHIEPDHKLEGPAGVATVVEMLAGYEIPAAAWEREILPARVKGYLMGWLDQLTLGGSVAWGRLWGASNAPIKTTPLTLLPRDELFEWWRLAGPPETGELSSNAQVIAEVLQQRGAIFPQELQALSGLLPEHFEGGLSELVSAGLATCDSFGGLRRLITPPSRRPSRPRPIRSRLPVAGPASGRWSFFRPTVELPVPAADDDDGIRLPGSEYSEEQVGFVADRLLRRYGVVFRKVLQRERQPVPWRDLVRVLRLRELRGDVRGGRFVAGFDGEQYALPEAVPALRKIRREDDPSEPLTVSAADPLNLVGILTPGKRIASSSKQSVTLPVATRVAARS